MRVRLVVNPHSRRGRRLGSRVREELERAGIEVVGDGARTDAIVVAGGDGTLSRAIGPAIELDVPIGIVPLGTFNELARTLAIPSDVARACAAIAGGNTRTIDVARVNGAYYVNEASIGISSRIARRQRPADKQRWGAFAILMSVLWIFALWRRFRVEVAFDGTSEGLRAVQLTVANSHRFGGVVNVEGAAIDDGWLDLFCVEGMSLRGPVVRRYRSRAFAVTTRRPHRISADGEPAGRTPARFEVVPGALRVFAP